MNHSRLPVSFIATDNPEEARTFFADVLGLELLEATPFAIVFSDGGHVLRIQIVSEFEPTTYTVHGWLVTDIADEIEGLVSKGVKFKRFDQLAQDALGIWTTPQGDMIAWFADPSGNTFSLTQQVTT